RLIVLVLVQRESTELFFIQKNQVFASERDVQVIFVHTVQVIVQVTFILNFKN
ncbi:4504_t:CDS:1, partial [Cetraspora pellucida]